MGTSKKLHGLFKSERLCNFTFKKILFNQGNFFNEYPFRVQWKLIDQNLEKIFFADEVCEFSVRCKTEPINWRSEQNPSFPFLKVPLNAFFPYPMQVLISVPARTHKKAVVRNHLKRLTREAYRKNKNLLYPLVENNDKLLLLGFIYTTNSVLIASEIEQKIVVSLQKLGKKIYNG